MRKRGHDPSAATYGRIIYDIVVFCSVLVQHLDLQIRVLAGVSEGARSYYLTGLASVYLCIEHLILQSQAHDISLTLQNP